MDKSKALAAFSALAQPTRLAAFRRLLAKYPDAVSAGHIARHCRVPHNTMSSHLAILSRAGLIAASRNGRSMNYKASLEGFRALITFLTRDCCNGRSELCAPVLSGLSQDCGPSVLEPRHG